MHLPSRTGVLLLLLISIWVGNLSAKTRWSSFHCIPDADLIGGGGILFDVNGYFLVGAPEGLTVKPSGMVTLGIIEWVNISGGYAGGPTFGLKARVLGETKEWMPSLALGVRNIFSHEESYWYNSKNDSISNEVYCAVGKGIENLRLRINAGVQSIPENELDKVNPFAGVEKYFGNGLYVTFEFFRRQKEYVMALFVDWRFLNRRAELYAGVVDIAGLTSGISKEGETAGFVQPGIRGGIRLFLNMNRGKSDVFTSLEDRVSLQNATITSLKDDLDSLKAIMKIGSSRIEGLSKSLQDIADSASSDDGRFKTIAIEKLSKLKSLFEQEPFEPEQVKIALRELVIHRDNVLPALYDIAIDKREGTRIRTLAVSVCGEIGTSAASDILIEVLGQTQVPEIRIEALIALGKLKDLRATYLMQQLATDPNDAVAFTASEVLQKLEKETGIPLTTPLKPNPPLSSIPENKIGVRSAGGTGLNEVIEETTRSQNTDQTIQKVEKREFTESIVGTAVPEDSIENANAVLDSTEINSQSEIQMPSMENNPALSTESGDSTTQKDSTPTDTTTTSVSEPKPPQDAPPPEKLSRRDARKVKKEQEAMDKVAETGDW